MVVFVMMAPRKELVSNFSKIVFLTYIKLISVLFLGYMNSIGIDKTLDFNNLYQLKLFILTTETLNILKRALENLSSLEKNKSSKPSKLNKFRTFRKHRKASKSRLMKMIARINDVWINDLQTALTGKMGEIGKKQKQVLTKPKRPEENTGKDDSDQEMKETGNDDKPRKVF